MKIIYFTASGNSLSVAKKFDAELLSIPQLIKNDNYLISDEVVGIIYPVHGWTTPRIVKEYISKVTIKAKYIFVIATFGNKSGSAMECMNKLLIKNNIKADYMRSLLMVDSYVLLFDIDKELKNIENKHIKKNIDEIVKDINSRKEYIERKNVFSKMFSCFMDYIGTKFMRFLPPKLFYVSDECIKCGICSKVCPSKNIIQKEDNHPQFGKKCESCFACLHNCPKKAIHIKFEKSKSRYRNKDINVDEIISSNNQK